MKGLVKSPQDQNDALKEAAGALASIALSSAYCAACDKRFNDIIPFIEFHEVFDKITTWSMQFDERLKEIEGSDEKNSTD